MFGQKDQRDKKAREVFQKGTAFKDFALFEEANLNNRDYMEDQSFMVDCYLDHCPKSALFGIFDGHGGGEASSLLVKSLPHIFRESYTKNKKKVKLALEQCFEIADKQIAVKKIESGSTGSIALLTLEEAKRVLYVANVGDSSIYIFDDSNAEKLTIDHRCDNKNQIQRIRDAGGKILMGRVGGLLAVTRAFGDFGLKQTGCGLIVKPDVHKIEVRLSHKYIVAASDGLWDYVDIKAVHKILKEGETDSIAKKLMKLALSGGSVDNISVIVVQL